MRLTSIRRSELSHPTFRVDAPFHIRRHNIDKLIGHETQAHATLGDLLAELHEGARLPSSSEGIPVLRLNNLRACEIDLRNVGFVAAEGASKWPAVRPGDVLFTRSAAPFRAAVAGPDIPGLLTVSPEITVLRPLPAVVPEYLAAVLSTAAYSSVLQDLAYEGRPSALQRLRLSDLRSLPIPLPARSIQESIRGAYRRTVELSFQAHDEMARVIKAVHAQIDQRLPAHDPVPRRFNVRRTNLGARWDVSYLRGRQIREALASPIMRPVLEIARPIPTTLRGIQDEDEVLSVQSADINEATFLVEGATRQRFADLSARMRQPLSTGDVLLCTIGAGQQIAYLDESLSEANIPILGSATFTALRFHETPRFYAVALSHSVVREQIGMLATGSVQRFVNKRDLDELLVPQLGSVWREDFEARIQRAMQRRREALAARAELLATAEGFIRQRWAQ
jgi:hypothetical protein